MPVDASIYGKLRTQPQMEGPMDQFGRAMQIKNLMGAGQLQGLQLQQAQQGMEEQQKLRALFGGGGSVSAPINLAGRTHVIPGQTTDGGVVELPGGRVDPLPSPAQPTSQAPQPFASPWERPGRNARLAEKYGFDVAGGGYDY